MALSIPDYIREVSVQDKTIRYLWDDWNVEQAEEPVDEVFLARLQGMSQRAIITFTTGTAEWIIHRFTTLSDDPIPLHYLEAAWAMMVDLRYCGVTWQEYTNAAKEWVGPVRRPLGLAMIRVEYTFEAVIEYGNPEISGAWLTNLAQYVLTDPAPYQKWRERVMQRLDTLYPLNPQDKLGEAVPREALDPDFDFHMEHTESLVNKYVASLDYKTNPFLNSPKKMLEQGFEGTPYVFDIEKDRARRGRIREEHHE